ncbi:MAG: S9 family peptidase [Bacteroidia bacterium]|nr:S9 family peptidase [Bacteroidia bacterium]
MLIKTKQNPHKLLTHGYERTDPYFWLRDRENPEVIAHLEAENAATKASMAHTEYLQNQLFEEMKNRIKPDDSSVAYRLDNYYYYNRFELGKEYPIYCRRKEDMKNPEEIILDVNLLAQGKNFCELGGSTVSTDHRYLAYAVDYQGRRIYTIYIKDLETGDLLSDEIPGVTGNMVWAIDNFTLFYSKQDEVTLRSDRVFRHRRGTSVAEDVLVFEEKDETYYIQVNKSKSRKYLFIHSSSTLSDEVSYLESANPEGTFTVILPREKEHEYAVDHLGEDFYVLTNDQAKNFRLVKTPVINPSRTHWTEIMPHRPDVLLEGIEIFRDFLVLDERKNGLNQIRIMPWSGVGEYYLEFPDPAYSAGVDFNPEFDTQVLRFSYQSLTTPASTFDFDMISRERTLLKQQEVLGGFSPENYLSERIFAQAADGTSVPISLVYHKDTVKKGDAPLLLYGYGSYGYSMDPYFSAARLSLLDRGFIYAIAHIRGGSDLGRQWYEDGKMLRKKNTFTDFIACGEYLIKEGYTRKGKLFCMGGSAGGLLVGAVINMRPDLFFGAVASVPFVDVVTTMLDEDIPLTTGEYDEWGNPAEKEYFEYMLSYSPYDNIQKCPYPHLLVTSGLHDSQVQYWEPTKWVAKIRDYRTNDNRLLLHTNMSAGHGGASGRFEPYREVALEYAFLLDLAFPELVNIR